MDGLDSYLSKYTSLGISKRKQKEVVAKVITTICGVKVHASQVTIDFGVAHTQVPSSLRWVMSEKKKEILSQITNELGSRQVTDVR